jgi:1,4-alpha-glucan branching enzyme
MRNRLFSALLIGLFVVGCSTITGSIRDRLPPPHEVKGGILFEYEAPAARMVTLAGNFNNWGGTEGGGRYDPTIDPMTNDGNGIWSIVKPLPPGRYQYKFVIDNGVRWELDPNNANTGEEGGITNSLIIVPESVSYAYGVVTGTELSGTKTGVQKPQAGVEREVTFELDYPDAAQVNLAGEFNNWSPTDTKMEKGGDGIWRVNLNLKPGVYEYKFVIDGGTWIGDPKNPNKVADPYGGNNSVITVE